MSFDAVGTLQSYPKIDMVVMGEGERTISELVAANFDKAALPRITGLAYRRERHDRDDGTEGVHRGHQYPSSSGAASPSSFPVSGPGVSDQHDYGGAARINAFSVKAGGWSGKKVRQRKAEFVVDEIENILSYGFSRINIADDLFVSDRQKVKDVAEIQRRGLRFDWSAFARVNTVDRETLRIMRETGCDSISFGVESGNQEILDRIGKKITLEQVRNAVDMCKDVGLIVHASFIAGLPGETFETLNAPGSLPKASAYITAIISSPLSRERRYARGWTITIWRS